MLNQTVRRLGLKAILIVPWLAMNLSHASEPVFVLKAQLVVEKVYAIVGPLGQRSVANAGLNANYGFVVTEQGVILIDSGASAHSAAGTDSVRSLQSTSTSSRSISPATNSSAGAVA